MRPAPLLARAALVALALLVGLPAAGQDVLPESEPQAPSVDPALASPRDTMHTFLVAMNDLWTSPGAWDDAISTLPRQEDRAIARDQARELYKALNHITLVDVDDLPGRAQAADLHEYQFFPDPRRDAALPVRGRPVEILLEARDYDGGTKAWVRFRDGGGEAVVPGSLLG